MASPKSVASLMRKALDRQQAIARVNFKFQKNQVQQTLISYIKDENLAPYNELLKILQTFPLNDNNYKILLEESLSSVVLLGRKLNKFVELVCSIEWASRSEELVELYSKFVISLLTAHNYHCPQVLVCLLKVIKADGENWEDSPPLEILSMWSNIHKLIAQVVAIIPMSSDLLMQILIDQFPYYKAGTYNNRAYVHNLIWISKYIPLLQEQIITAIISRMVIMDVNIVDLSKAKTQPEIIFEMDTMEQETIIDTLDYCMLEVLNWLEEERDPALKIMCNIFDRVVLPTYGIRYVQFLVLYTISISQHCADRVLNNLWMVAAGLHGHGPGALATRRTAISHLSGLLARCVRVPNSRMIHYLKNMAEWCHSYITATQESTTASDNIKVHGAFHVICHAIFYLVAFKNHYLFMNKENVLFVESLNLPRLVASSLNPLRTCPPQVTHAFSSVTRAHQVCYCQAVIDKNNRHTLQANPVEKFDDWFPYDPYTLPNSGKIIWPLCIEYKDFMNGENESQYSSMKRKLDEDDDYLMSTSPNQKLSNALSNTVSPGFRTSESIAM